MNINTKEYWDKRFETGSWEKCGGREQSFNFARSQIEYLKIPHDIKGSIIDFGCGMGDAFPVYRKYFKEAKLTGIDFSASAIKKSKEKYGHIADFYVGDQFSVPETDIIIASNTFEHLSNDKEIEQT